MQYQHYSQQIAGYTKNIKSIDISLFPQYSNNVQNTSDSFMSKEINLNLTQSQRNELSERKNNNFRYNTEYRENCLLETPKNSTILNQSRENFFSSLYNKAKEYSTHKEHLKTQEDQKELKECYFSPKINRNPSGDSKRSLNCFLEDQKKFENQKKNKQVFLKELVKQEEIKELTLIPKINSTKGQVQRDSSVPIHERLYSLKDIKQRKNSINKLNEIVGQGKDNKSNQSFKQQGIGYVSNNNVSISLEESGLFSPRINEKSKSLMRKDHISVLLYKDAQRRNEKNRKSFQERSSSVYSRRESSLSSIQINERSEQVYTNSFIKLFQNAWDSVFNSTEQTETSQTFIQRVDYLKMNQILENLLFLTPQGQIANQQNLANPNIAKERSLVYDIWSNLKGDKYKGVSKRNLGLFLLVLQGIKNPHSFDEFSKIYPGTSRNADSSKQINSTFSLESATDLAESSQAKNKQTKNSNAKKVTQISIVNSDSQNNSMLTNQMANQREYISIQINLNNIKNDDQKFSENMRQLAERVMSESMEQKKVFGYFEGENWFVGNDQFQIQIKYDLLIKTRLNQQNIGNISQKVIDEQEKKNKPKKNNPNYFSGRIIQIDLQKPQNINRYVDILVKQKKLQQKKHEQMRKEEIEKELEECTFQPNQSKNRGKNRDKSSGMERSLNLYNKSFKTSSSKRDKATLELEYEKQCDECTFAPDISKTKNFNSMKQKYSEDYQTFNRQGFDESVERIRQTRLVTQNQSLIHQRGYHDLPNYQTMSYISNVSDKQKQSFFSTSNGAFRTFDL